MICSKTSALTAYDEIVLRVISDDQHGYDGSVVVNRRSDSRIRDSHFTTCANSVLYNRDAGTVDQASCVRGLAFLDDYLIKFMINNQSHGIKSMHYPNNGAMERRRQQI